MRMEIDEVEGVGRREDIGGNLFLLCPSGQSRAPIALGVWVMALLRSTMAPAWLVETLTSKRGRWHGVGFLVRV